MKVNTGVLLLLSILALAVGTILSLTLTAGGDNGLRVRDLPIVCHANEDPQVQAPQSGDYGVVTRQVCYRGSFDGAEVVVLFVD